MLATRRNNYDFIARCYGPLAQLYSLGQIRACKRSQLRELGPGQRVLYTGVGGGEDAVLAAALGAQVTVIDLSAGMLAQATRRFRAAGLERAIEVIHGDLLEHAREGHYDVVVSNFFLNVFAPEPMAAVLSHLVRLLRPGGKLLIADFAPAAGHGLARAAQRAYFALAVLSFRLLANNALHPLYDYASLFQGAGLRLEASRGFGLLGLGPAFYATLTATRVR